MSEVSVVNEVVTDESRKFVLGVATRSDLEEFAKRRIF
jgi:hypothetical protein